MRIGNPLPTLLGTVQVSGIVSPQVMTTGPLQSISIGGLVDITPVSLQKEIVITNLDTAIPVFVRDTAAATTGVGTRIAPLGVGVFTLNATVRVTNGGSSVVNIAYNQISG